MTTIVTRFGKGSSLSWTEVDSNFNNLNSDKAEVSDMNLKAPIDSPTFTGTVSGISAAEITLTPTGNISSTNTQAGIAELEAEKAALAGADFSGNVSIPKTQMGISATASENHFWDGSVANQLSLKRGTPDAPGVTVMLENAGIVKFPQRVTGPGTILAACVFNGSLTGTNAPIDGFEVTSVTRNSAGNYTLTLGASYANNSFFVALAADNAALNLFLWASATLNTITVTNYVAGVPADLQRGFVTISRAD